MSITRLIYTWLEIFAILIDFLPTKSESIKKNRDKQTRRNKRQTASDLKDFLLNEESKEVEKTREKLMFNNAMRYKTHILRPNEKKWMDGVRRGCEEERRRILKHQQISH